LAVAAHWYARSAEQGQPQAQFFLGTMYFYGDGVGRDLVQAFAWCELAQANGAPDALECREAAGRHMTAAEVTESFRLVADWFGRHAVTSKQ
jgi:TPR repeat protein